jgi:transposase
MKREELAELSKDQLVEIIAPLVDRIVQLEAELEELKGPKGKSAPDWVKQNRPKKDQNEKRRKRAHDQNHGRCIETPTRSVDHQLEHCPECTCRLDGGNLDYARQVIELPPPQPVEVIEHRLIKRFCPHCRLWQSPKLDLSGQVFGRGRIGVRITSLIAYLRNALRLPVRRIQAYLLAIHQLKISIGEIVELLHEMRRVTNEDVENLKRQALASNVLHADETGWREAGQGGYIWSFSTPGEHGVRYYEYDHSRAHAVVQRILADEFHGHLVSDFYAGYNDYAGPKQRCWVHLLRDLHKLKEEHGENSDVMEWAQAVRKLYDETKEWLKTAVAPPRKKREIRYVELVGKAHQLGLGYARSKQHPCQALAKRLLRHEDELFQFVLVEGLSADNNLAERSIRPLVVIRKISGGSRGEEGTKTRMALASLFETWQVRGLNAFAESLKLLSCGVAPST